MDDRKYLEGEVVACAGSALEDMSDGESFDAALEEQIRLRAELPAPAVYVPRDQVGQLVREEIATALSRVGRRSSDRPERDLQELAKDEREWILESGDPGPARARSAHRRRFPSCLVLPAILHLGIQPTLKPRVSRSAHPTKRDADPRHRESDEDNRITCTSPGTRSGLTPRPSPGCGRTPGTRKARPEVSNEGPPTSGLALCDTPHPGFRAVLHIGTVLTGGGDPNRRRLPLSVAGHPLPPALLSRTWTKGRCTTA